MSETTNFHSKEGINKLKDLIEEINTCLFCTNLKMDDGSTCRPMAAQNVDSDGSIWFFSEADSDKNREIKQDKNVQLFFADPHSSSYLIVNGEAEIIFDPVKIEELWSPLLKAWFKEGKEDPSISLIRVNTISAYYWDTGGIKMINFLKILTGSHLLASKEGNITV